MNAMMVLRGHRADYDGWAAAGCAGWSWDDVEPAFAAAQRRFRSPSFPTGTSSPMHSSTPRRLPASRSPPTSTARTTRASGFVPVSQRRGRRFSVLDGYLGPARRRPNLTVVTGALATRILVADGKAVGVVYRTKDDDIEDEARCSREVVVCAGAIGSPHLLQLSGIGPRGALEEAGVEVVHEHPSVGTNLLDHLANGLLVRTKGVETLASAESLRNLVRWALRGSRSAHVEPRRGGRVRAVSPRSRLPPTSSSSSRPVLFEEEGLKPPTEHGLTLAVVLLRPSQRRNRAAPVGRTPAIPRRSIRATSRDPGGDDAATLLRGLRLARRVLAQEPLASFVDGEILPGDDARSDDALLAHVRDALADALPPGGDVPHGLGRGVGRRPATFASRNRGAPDRGRLGHADAPARSHELADGDDRRARLGARRPQPL